MTLVAAYTELLKRLAMPVEEALKVVETWKPIIYKNGEYHYE